MPESSTKPYLLRALHEWCTDNGYTPHIVVHVDENTVVPMSHVQDDQITLNIGLLATHMLNLGNDYIEFQRRYRRHLRSCGCCICYFCTRNRCRYGL